MVDLYKDIDWNDYFENLDDETYDHFEMQREIRKICGEYLTTKDFQNQYIRKPVLDQTFPNFVIGRLNNNNNSYGTACL